LGSGFVICSTLKSIFFDKRKYKIKLHILMTTLLLIWGIHGMTYPFAVVSGNEEYLAIGFTIFVFISVAMAMILPKFILEVVSYEYQQTLKEEVNQRSNMLMSSVKMSSLGELSGGIAHEINNPLQIISLSYQKLIQSGALTDEGVYSKNIKTSVKRISSVIESLTHFGGKSKVDDVISFKLSGLIYDYIHITKQKFKESEIEVTVIDRTNEKNIKGNNKSWHKSFLN